MFLFVAFLIFSGALFGAAYYVFVDPAADAEDQSCRPPAGTCERAQVSGHGRRPICPP